MAVLYDLYLISFPIDFSFSHSRGSVLRERAGCRPILRLCGEFESLSHRQGDHQGAALGL